MTSHGSCPHSIALGAAARLKGWRVTTADKCRSLRAHQPVAYWGGLDVTLEIASRLGLALIEPPLDLLARLPIEFLHRQVRFTSLGRIGQLDGPTFIKPADAMDQAFDAGVYSSVDEIRLPSGLDPASPVLLSEPVEWDCEMRCFVCDGQIRAWSSYMSFGCTVWKPFVVGRSIVTAPPVLVRFCERLFAQMSGDIPSAVVVDIGLIPDRGWAVVEFNPAWGSNPLGAEPAGVLDVLERACGRNATISPADRRWLIERARVDSDSPRLSYNPGTIASFRFTDGPTTKTKTPHYA